VPTVIELGCADPDEPCRLPAGLQSDPYLKQVRATSLEAGLRWRPAPGQRLELALFRTDNRDDIVFGSVSATSQLGYFQQLQPHPPPGAGPSWQAVYGHAGTVGRPTATCRPPTRPTASCAWASATSPSPGHAHGRAAAPQRQAGRRLARWAGPERGRRPAGVSSRGVQGNEDGLLEDGGRAASYGALAETPFNAQGAYTGTTRDALFVAPLAPRSAFVGVRLRY
jgi:hypothetical protein